MLRNSSRPPYRAKDGKGLARFPNSCSNVLIRASCLTDLAAEVDKLLNILLPLVMMTLFFLIFHEKKFLAKILGFMTKEKVYETFCLLQSFEYQ